MEIKNQDESQLFINELDKNTRENIISLDQKLRGLHAEIEAKLHSSAHYEVEDKPRYIEGLTLLKEEVQKAIAGIEALVNLVLTDDQELKKIFLQSQDLQQFSRVLADNLAKLTQVKEIF